MFKRILLATDGSAASENAARTAVELARAHGARLTAVYVVDPYPYLGIGEANPMGFDAYMAAARDHAAQAHTRVTQLAGGPGEALDVQLRLVEDVSALDGILNTARDEGADLIVVGSHGRSGVGRVFLGSVAGKVVAQSKVPVLVVR
ncbi:universal stress protein [Ramlibacter sp. AN1015]|uniref:universal stress protein n=1 Tax=Ramlibacter sp. AN1015 TaxID=3133428 RepID=UPI0030C5DF45